MGCLNAGVRLGLVGGLCLGAAGSALAQITQEAFVSNYGTSTVSVIDTATNTVVGSPVAVGSYPYGLASTADSRYV